MSNETQGQDQGQEQLDCSDTAAGVFGRKVFEERQLFIKAHVDYKSQGIAEDECVDLRVITRKTTNPKVFVAFCGQTGTPFANQIPIGGTLNQVADLLSKQLKQNILDWGELLAKEDEEPEDSNDPGETEGTVPDETTDVLYGSSPGDRTLGGFQAAVPMTVVVPPEPPEVE